MKKKIVVLILSFIIFLLGMFFCFTSIQENNIEIIKTPQAEIIMHEEIHTKLMRRIISVDPVNIYSNDKLICRIEYLEIILFESTLGYILDFAFYFKNFGYMPENNKYLFDVFLYNDNRIIYTYKFSIINITKEIDFFGEQNTALSKPQYLFLSSVERIEIKLKEMKWRKSNGKM